jgi:hypothetical protein
MVQSLFETLDACPFKDSIAVVGSALGASGGARGTPTAVWVEVCSVITSGSLVRVESCLQLGGFRTDFFVDYVDHEFCLRARRAGYRIIRTVLPMMMHNIGYPETTSVSLEGGDRQPSHGPAALLHHAEPDRVWRAFFRSDPGFVLSDAVRALVHEMIKILFFERDRRLKLRAVAAGVIDSLTGRFGPCLRSDFAQTPGLRGNVSEVTVRHWRCSARLTGLTPSKCAQLPLR